MAKYETLPTITLNKDQTVLRTSKLPELVHLDDPALLVLTDFNQTKPHTISPNESMDDALNEMKVHGVHLLLVKDDEGLIIGVIASEDIMGERPILILQERRLARKDILVKMLMTPIEKIAALEIKSLQNTKVGNIVNTLKSINQHYLLVFEKNDEEILRGIFTTSQVSRQLHKEVADSVAKAQSISELKKRHTKD